MSQTERISFKGSKDNRYYKQIESLASRWIRPQQFFLYCSSLDKTILIQPLPHHFLHRLEGLLVSLNSVVQFRSQFVTEIVLVIHLEIVLDEITKQLVTVWLLYQLVQVFGSKGPELEEISPMHSLFSILLLNYLFSKYNLQYLSTMPLIKLIFI